MDVDPGGEDFGFLLKIGAMQWHVSDLMLQVEKENL